MKSVTPPKAPLHRTTPTNGLRRGTGPPTCGRQFRAALPDAERAYGLGDNAEAHAVASALWDQLESASDEHDPSLVLGWRAVVSLLLGHIQLHGLQQLQQPEQAAISYELVC